jgi:hypothetical protein
MNNVNVNDSHLLRGTILIIIGLATLLHTLGILDVSISFIYVAASIAVIAYGFYISGLYDTAKKYLRK